MRARTLLAVCVGFGLGALAGLALSLVRRPAPIDTTGYQPPIPAEGQQAG